MTRTKGQVTGAKGQVTGAKGHRRQTRMRRKRPSWRNWWKPGLVTAMVATETGRANDDRKRHVVRLGYDLDHLWRCLLDNHFRFFLIINRFLAISLCRRG